MPNAFENYSRESEKHLDDKWYSRIVEIAGQEAYMYLDGNEECRNNQKKLFLEGEVKNPDLDYPSLDANKLEENVKELLSLKRDVLAREENEIVKQAYRWRINEKIAEFRMLQCALEGRSADLSEKNRKMRRFKRYSEFIYGKPSQEVFSYTVAGLNSIVKQHLNSENPEIKKAAEELYKNIPRNLTAVNMYNLPDKGTIEDAKKKIDEELGDIFDIAIVSAKEKYTGGEIKEIVEKIFQVIGADGWNAILDKSSRSRGGINQGKKEINIPESKLLSLEGLKLFLVHEINTHVKRRIVGEKSKLKLLGIGLDRYEKGEEGAATLRTQAYKGEMKDFTGLEGHLAISLAYGLDGEKRDFRDLFEIMKRYYYFNSLVSGEKAEIAEKYSQSKAWNICVATFRGTNCSMPGVCLTKDIVYREGNIGTWEIIGKNTEHFFKLSIGKYDIANPRHIWILDQLGISDSDLEDLEK